VLGFYEWQVLEGNNKQKWYITLPKQKTFALAGLWERSDDLESATICTVEANPLLAKVHNKRKRMPLILDPKDFDAWLADDNGKAEKVIRKFPAARMQAWPVTRTSANAPRCIKQES
jgi:putative SOS response-associated peptidase YedK